MTAAAADRIYRAFFILYGVRKPEFQAIGFEGQWLCFGRKAKKKQQRCMNDSVFQFRLGLISSFPSVS